MVLREIQMEARFAVMANMCFLLYLEGYLLHCAYNAK